MTTFDNVPGAGDVIDARPGDDSIGPLRDGEPNAVRCGEGHATVHSFDADLDTIDADCEDVSYPFPTA